MAYDYKDKAKQKQEPQEPEALSQEGIATMAGVYGEAREDAVSEGLAADRDPSSTVKPVYDKKAEAEDMFAPGGGVEAQVSQLSRKTAEELKKFPKHKVMIPADKLNPGHGSVVVGINGWNIQIMRGVPVLLPEPVIELLVNGGYNPTHIK